MRTLSTLTALLITLTACTPMVYTPTVIKEPVIAPCKHDPITPPPSVVRQLPANADIFDESKAALVEISYRQIYENSLVAALKACGG